MDRRAARTRTALFDALVRLVREKPFDDITVDDLVREANVGRTTFYAHFVSKADLLDRCLDRLRDELVEAARADSTAPISLILFRHIEAYRDVRGAIQSGRGSAMLQQAVDRALAAALRVILPAEHGKGMPRELAIRTIVAEINVVMQWSTERKLAASEAEALFRSLLLGGLSAEFCAPLVGR